MSTVYVKSQDGSISSYDFDLIGDPFTPPADFMPKVYALDDYPTLPVPKPKSKFDILPQMSNVLTLVQVDTQPFVTCWALGNPPQPGTFPGRFAAYGQSGFPMGGNPQLHLDPAFPIGAKIAYNIYWSMQKSYTLTGPQNFSDEIDYTQGATETDTTTMSAELGVDVKYLSAKLTKTVSRSVSVNTETTEKRITSTTVDKGIVRVWTVWQLVETYQLLASDGTPLPAYSGGVYGSPLIGKVSDAVFPGGELVNKTPIIFEDATDFPATP